MEIFIIVVLVVGSAAGYWLMALAAKRGKQNEKALAELARSKNWSLEKHASKARKPGYTELSDANESWNLRIYSGNRSGASALTHWCDPTLALPSGLAVYSSPLPDKTQQMFNVMMEKYGGFGRMMLDTVFTGLGPEARNLRAIDDDDPATLMTTPGAEAAFNPLKGVQELENLNRFGTNPADVPFLVRDEKGLSLRVNKSLSDTDDIAAFVDVARSFSRMYKT